MTGADHHPELDRSRRYPPSATWRCSTAAWPRGATRCSPTWTAELRVAVGRTDGARGGGPVPPHRRHRGPGARTVASERSAGATACPAGSRAWHRRSAGRRGHEPAHSTSWWRAPAPRRFAGSSAPPATARHDVGSGASGCGTRAGAELAAQGASSAPASGADRRRAGVRRLRHVLLHALEDLERPVQVLALVGGHHARAQQRAAALDGRIDGHVHVDARRRRARATASRRASRRPPAPARSA